MGPEEELPATRKSGRMQVIKQVKREVWLEETLPATIEIRAMQVIKQAKRGVWREERYLQREEVEECR